MKPNDLKDLIDTVSAKVRKETVMEIFDELYEWLALEEIEKYGFVTIQKFDFLRKFRALIGRYGGEVEE